MDIGVEFVGSSHTGLPDPSDDSRLLVEQWIRDVQFPRGELLGNVFQSMVLQKRGSPKRNKLMMNLRP